MSTFQPDSMDEAVASIRPVDELGVPLGPGHPIGLLHALGARDDWEDLTVAGALLTDLYDLFTKPKREQTSDYITGRFG